MKNIFFLIFFILIAQATFSQNCLNFNKNCELYDGKPYHFDENSSSFLLTSDKPVEITFDALYGIDYNINICSDTFSLPLHFVIYDINNNLLFDNKSENYTLNFAFSVKEAKKLRIMLTVDEACLNNDKKKYYICSGCVGILIKKSIKQRTGF